MVPKSNGEVFNVTLYQLFVATQPAKTITQGDLLHMLMFSNHSLFSSPLHENILQLIVFLKTNLKSQLVLLDFLKIKTKCIKNQNIKLKFKLPFSALKITLLSLKEALNSVKQLSQNLKTSSSFFVRTNFNIQRSPLSKLKNLKRLTFGLLKARRAKPSRLICFKIAQGRSRE